MIDLTKLLKFISNYILYYAITYYRDIIILLLYYIVCNYKVIYFNIPVNI